MSASESAWGVPIAPREIVENLRQRGRTLVALSGGVDSAVVAALAVEALGRETIAATITGPAVGVQEIDRARAVATRLGVRHVLLRVDPVTVEEYRTNPSNRCYFCRSTEAGAMTSWGEAHAVRGYVDGIHVDDLSDTRPGLKAMDAAGFRHPLLEARWTKVRVRAYAREQGLPNWDAPSEACLASRVPHGRTITHVLLGRIDRAENHVRTLGFRRVRVRVEGGGARVIVDPDEVDRLRSPELAAHVTSLLGSLGFSTVELDPVGYRARPNG